MFVSKSYIEKKTSAAEREKGFFVLEMEVT